MSSIRILLTIFMDDRKSGDAKRFGIFYPFVAEALKKRAGVKTQDNPAVPFLYDVVPVCECCYYMYSLYRCKREKLKTPRPMLEKIVFPLSSTSQ